MCTYSDNFFEGNRRGVLPPCGKLIPAPKDDHMIRNADLYRSWPVERLLPGTLSFILEQRAAVEKSFETRRAAGMAIGENPPKWTWDPQ